MEHVEVVNPNPTDTVLEPIRLAEVELGESLPNILSDHAGRQYGRAQVLVRIATIPVGSIDVTIDGDHLPASVLAHHIWQALHEPINDFLSGHALSPIDTLSEVALTDHVELQAIHTDIQRLTDPPLVSVVVCTRDRTEMLARAMQSLLNLEYPSYEIIVVDNAPKNLCDC